MHIPEVIIESENLCCMLIGGELSISVFSFCFGFLKGRLQFVKPVSCQI